MPTTNSITRFSSRVDDYINYRPHYPIEIIDLLAEKCALTPESVIADIGSGTGMLAKLFLENGNPVVGVEPNAEMRAAGEQYLAEFGRFTSMSGSAEATRLPAHAMDFVICGQAFHWFDRERTREEFLRLLKPDGVVVLVWNDRRHESTSFMRDYDALLQKYGRDYAEIDHKKVQTLDIEVLRIVETGSEKFAAKKRRKHVAVVNFFMVYLGVVAAVFLQQRLIVTHERCRFRPPVVPHQHHHAIGL